MNAFAGCTIWSFIRSRSFQKPIHEENFSHTCGKSEGTCVFRSTHPDDKAITAELTEAINKIEESQLSLLTVLGKENYFARKATFQMEEMKERLAFGKTVAK